jgi:hypothetical protein
MEEQKPFVIPTMSKAKISHLLSYPVGAEMVTRALDGVPQMNQLALQFYHWTDNALRRGNYEFLRVEYLKGVAPAEEYPIFLYRRPPLVQYQWEILVQPVPRIKRHNIRTYIGETALAAIKNWLMERAELKARGSTVLAFFFDEEKDEITMHQIERLEPRM